MAIFAGGIGQLLLLPSVQAADPVAGEALCNRPMSAITFIGNKVTQPAVMRRELPMVIGDDCSLDRVIDGLQEIMDLGLFKSVSVEILPAGSPVGDTVNVRYRVSEKLYFLPIPRFSRTSDGELRAGVQLRWDNFTGRLHQLKLTSEKRQEDDGRGRSGYVHRLDYSVPRFFGSDYGLNVGVGATRRNVGLERDGVLFGEALSVAEKVSMRVARWVNRNAGISGLRYVAGVAVEQRRLTLQEGEFGPLTDGLDAALVVGAESREIHRDVYRRRGREFGIRLRAGMPQLGSDFSYTRIDLSGAWYRPLPGGINNLNLQLRIGLSDGAPFGEHAYSIGGGELLRGVEPSRDSGEVLTLLNAEYLSAFYAYPAWRWVAFVDIGNVFLRDQVDLLNQNVRGGVGLRYKLTSITNTDIRIDVAWDPDEGKAAPYVSTSLTF